MIGQRLQRQLQRWINEIRLRQGEQRINGGSFMPGKHEDMNRGHEQLKRDLRTVSLQLALVLTLGFGAVGSLTYINAITTARQQLLESSLPLALDGLAAQLQQEVTLPIQVASQMAVNSFLEDWLIRGETNSWQLQDYLRRIQRQTRATTAFLVSNQTGRYYHPNGIIKVISKNDPQDAWYYRLRQSGSTFELNLDRDTADPSRFTVFTNYKVLSADDGRMLGAVGTGNATTVLTDLIRRFERSRGVKVIFMAKDGRILFADDRNKTPASRLAATQSLGMHARQALKQSHASFSYWSNGREYFARSRFIPELNWHLVVSAPIRVPSNYIFRLLTETAVIALCTLVLVVLSVLILIRRYQQRLEHFAFTDQLSGALNRKALPRVLLGLTSHFTKAGESLALAMLDVDHFKVINDQYGHASGDAVIQWVSDQIRSCTRPGDHLFRWGGEEFLLILPRANLETACTIVERIPAALTPGLQLSGNDLIAVTLSIGVAERGDGEDFENLLHRADQAMYKAKTAGRDRIIATGPGR